MHVLGKWYAREPGRYYAIIGMPTRAVSKYKLYVYERDNGDLVYDSFIMHTDESVTALKVERTFNIQIFNKEVENGHLVRTL